MIDWTRIEGTQFMKPPTGKVTCKICHMGDFTGYVDVNNGRQYPSDMNHEVHEGFTIGRGKTLYWMMIWHSTGNVTVVNKEATYKKWISGDTEITIHWKLNP
jgi:hypothetical protein